MRYKMRRTRGYTILVYLLICFLVLTLYRNVERLCLSRNAIISFRCLRSLITPERITTIPRYYDYVIENQNMCGDVGSTYVIVLVHTSTDHFRQRERIRNSTLNNKILSEAYNAKLIFVIGKSNSKSNQTLIDFESKCFGDIIQGNFLDTYSNLTHKALFGFQWILDHCKQARFVMKIDDDVLLDMAGVVSLLSTKYADSKRTIMCRVKLKGTDLISRKGKWAIPLTKYPMEYWSVTHCSGYFMIFTADIIHDLYAAARRTPFLWIDDVYVPGFLAAAAGNITHYKPDDILRHVKLTGVHY